MAAHQAPPSLGLSRQEHWSGLPFPSPMHERKSESEVSQSCPTLSDPMDCSRPGSSIHRIFQARVLEWGAIAFSVSEATYTLFSKYKANYQNTRSNVECSLKEKKKNWTKLNYESQVLPSFESRKWMPVYVTPCF